MWVIAWVCSRSRDGEEINHDSDEPVQGFATGQRRPHSLLRGTVLEDSLAQARESITQFCSVCCRFLPPKNVFLLTVADKIDVNTIEWPCLQYGKEPTKKNCQFTACVTRRVLDDKAVEYIDIYSS